MSPALEHPFLRHLPEPLAPLGELSLDLRWTWSHAGDRVFAALDAEIWARTENPWLILQSVSERRLEEVARDPAFLEELAQLQEARKRYLAEPGWFDRTYGDGRLARVAFFSMEYGLTQALPIYSGGLGILAGDHLKTASDLGVPLVGVGLLYQEGYFRQMLDAGGLQIEVYPHNVPSSMPIAPVRGPDGAWLAVPIELPGRVALLRVWRAQVGRVPLLLLDSNDPLNSPVDRGITSKLYAGEREMRLVQEIALGIGGWRALEALGISPDVCHLNEGHAAPVTLERARFHMMRHGCDFWEALWATRGGNVLTTHTAVSAAFDRFPVGLLAKYGRAYAEEQLRIDPMQLVALGRPNGASEQFTMTYMAARTCSLINGVSALHGEVSRRIFQPLYPRWPQSEVPVGHVTNGVHMPTWDSPAADRLWTEACGANRWSSDSLSALAEAIDHVPDDSLWELASTQRRVLVRYARQRLARQVGERGGGASEVAAAETVLDPNVLTIGFARRFTEYKRPCLLLADPERLRRILMNPGRPVQLIVAGKAHPHDHVGKQTVKEWANFSGRTDTRNHSMFLEDYDIALAQELVHGVDVWLNTPRRPWEACGTSGMKVLVNGGLNVSVRDGWWAEAFEPEVGWAIGGEEEGAGGEQDAGDALELYRLLEEEIVPAFYDRDAGGVPRRWVAKMRASMARLAPRFSTSRMMREYVEKLYIPAAETHRERSVQGCAGDMRRWEAAVRRHWDEVRIASVDARTLGDRLVVTAQIYLGDIAPDQVAVELFADPRGSEAAAQRMERVAPIVGATNGYIYEASPQVDRPASDYSVRIVPYHPSVQIPAELPLIHWQR